MYNAQGSLECVANQETKHEPNNIEHFSFYTWTPEDILDRDGVQQTLKHVNVKSPEECMEKCMNIQGCSAVTYTRKTNDCFLKQKLGEKFRPERSNRFFYREIPKVGDIVANSRCRQDINRFSQLSESTCKQKCNSDNRCTGYSYDINTKNCYLNNNKCILEYPSSRYTGFYKRIKESEQSEPNQIKLQNGKLEAMQAAIEAANQAQIKAEKTHDPRDVEAANQAQIKAEKIMTALMIESLGMSMSL